VQTVGVKTSELCGWEVWSILHIHGLAMMGHAVKICCSRSNGLQRKQGDIATMWVLGPCPLGKWYGDRKSPSGRDWYSTTIWQADEQWEP